MKKNVLIIGAGGVAQVVAHKCAQNNDVLGDIHIASRTKAKCDKIIASVHEKKAMKQPGVIEGHALDALDMGLWERRRAGQDITGLIHHSDAGVQYRAIRYTERLAEAGLA